MKKNALPNKLALAILSVLCVIVFMHIGRNKDWFYNQTLYNYKKSRLDILDNKETVKKVFWGNGYSISDYLKNYFEEYNIEDPVVLFQPNEYYYKNNINFKAPEPVMYYYFTGGFKALWTSSDSVYTATHLVKVDEKGEMKLYRVASKKQITQFLEEYKDYNVAL